MAIMVSSAQAAEIGSFEFNGYTRGGMYSSPSGTPRGNYTLGGDMQKYRLGNEGDNGFEVGIGKTFDAGNGANFGVLYMPAVWGGKQVTAQAFATMSGLDIAPEAKFWAGQRRLRLKDVHVVDRFMLDYGDNTGAGVTDLNIGFAKLGVGVFTGGTFDNNSSSVNNASRINVDVSEISTNSGGKLRVLGTLVRGSFQMGAQGSGLSLLHEQSDFMAAGINNSLFLQTSNGHAAITGQFQGLGDVASGSTEQPGVQSIRIADSFDWQRGALGGQALVAYQTGKVQGGVSDGIKTTDVSVGGRVTYAVSRNFKWLAEVGSTSRRVDGQAQQSLNKFTIAPTLAVGPDFWSRPELRLYVTYATWNAAASAANAVVGQFGAGGRTSSTLAGIQMETWW
ncbi:MAG: carbohydrate porin [Sideroxydans sp.]|jgi:maltoporin